MTYIQAYTRLAEITEELTRTANPQLLNDLLEEAVRCCTVMSRHLAARS